MFSINAEVRPDYSAADKGGVLLGYCYDHIQQNFIIMQKGSSLGFYLTDTKNVHYIWVRHIFEKDQSVRIAITYDGKKITIFKNGTIQKVVAAADLDFSCWRSSYPFVFANTGIGNIAWSGTIYSLDIYDRDLVISNNRQRDSIQITISSVMSFSTPPETPNMISSPDGHSKVSIAIPALFHPPAKGLLANMYSLLGKWDWDAQDFFLNILFFMPLGLFLRSLVEKSTRSYSLSLWLTLIAALAMTIIIETTQIILPDRDTSIMDVLGNTLGALAGASLLAIPWIRRTLN